MEAEWSGEDLTRLVQGYEWTQDECWGLLCCVVSALGYAQSLGIAHGAVLPGSICKTDLGVYKLAGFQCPERQRSGESLWGVREPFYLCPDLRKAYARLLTGEDAGEIDCNVYKSDVYSTGLTLISLLTPSALPRLGNSAATSLCISSLPLHPQFQSVIRSMLEADARNRPDWQELQQIMRQVQGSESHEEEAKSEVKVEPAATEKKKRLKIVRKPQGFSEKPAESDSPSPAESSAKVCLGCKGQFHLNTAEAWRLDLIGSVDSEPAARYCSLPCFRPVSVPSPSPPVLETKSAKINLSIVNLAGQSFTAAEIERIGKSLIMKGSPQFYHCFQHKACLPSPSFSTKPSLLHQCPDCPAGRIEEEKMELLDMDVAHNSLYPSLVFVQSLLPLSIQNLALRVYMPVAASFKEALLRAKCHICENPVPRDTWVCYFHGQLAELVCSSVCLLRGTRTSTCPTCGESHGLRGGQISQKSAEMAEKRISILDPNSCDICKLSPCDWTLPCGCGFCVSCFTLIPNHPDVEEFSCFGCGAILRKDENRDLLEMLGWT